MVIEECEPSADELLALDGELERENAALREEVMQLQRRIDALMNEKAEAVREAVSSKRSLSRRVNPNKSTEVVSGRPF